MIPPALVDTLEHAYVGEERYYNKGTGKQDLPESLKVENLWAKVAEDKTTSPFGIWAKYKMPDIGSPENANPRTPSTGNSSNSNDGIKGGRLPVQPAQASRFLPLQDQARLHEWSKNIDVDADPALAADSPIEPEVVEDQGATRRVLDDSDSDAEELQRSQQVPPASSRHLLNDSDDDSHVQQRSPSPAKAAKPLLSLQEERIQAMRVNRSDRNRAAPGPTLALRSKQIVRTVDADNFFGDVPREAESGDSQVQASPAQGRAHDQNNNSTRRIRTYDGAADDLDLVEVDKTINVVQTNESMDNHRLEEEEQIDDKAPAGYMPSENFDPSRYGSRKRPTHSSPSRLPGRNNRDGGADQRWQATPPKRSRDQPLVYPSHSAVDSPYGNNRPVPSLPGTRDERNIQIKQPILVDISSETRQGTARPPPGLTRRTTPPPIPEDGLNLLDTPLDEIQRPAIKPSYEDMLYHNEDTSWSASSSSGGLRSRGLHYVPQTTIKKPDVSLMRSTVLQSLMAMKAQRSPVREKQTLSERGTERMEEDDEVSTRKFHDTMNLKAPKAVSRSKVKGNSSETPAQKQARLTKVKENLWRPAEGSNKPKVQISQQTTKASSNQISQKGLQAARKNPEMAALHNDALLYDQRQKVANELLQHLKPIFKAARCFPGEIGLEIQLGQLFVQPSSRIDTRKIYEIEKWKSIFSSENNTSEVRFTNMLTSDGADIDGMLDMKMTKHKMWSQQQPGTSDVSIEFKCLDSLSQEFQICLTGDHSYTLNRGPSAISKVALHCPGKLWDACVIVEGTIDLFETTPEFDSEVQKFISSVYVKAGRQTVVHFRQPTSNSLTIQAVVLRRTSFHNCQISEHESIQLKVVEVKDLAMKNHKSDKRLLRAIEERHQKLADEGRVHYEVSVVHKDINDAFDENLKFGTEQQLEIGDTTFAMAAKILTHQRLNILVQAALHVVDRIDWVGSRNYGSLRQKQDAIILRRQDTDRSVPPSMHQSLIPRPAHMPSGLSVAGPRTAFGAASTIGTRPFGATQAPHGIRQGTTAQIWQDAEGDLFHIGIGGARIPINTGDEEGMGRTEVLPGDSASQMGQDPSRHMKLRVGNQDHPDSFW